MPSAKKDGRGIFGMAGRSAAVTPSARHLSPASMSAASTNESSHAPSQRINGVLIFDRDMGAVRAEMDRDLRLMVGGSAALALVLVAAIALVVRLAVVRRLQLFATTARLVAAGDLTRRVPAAGSDTISWLAREFNTMADSMTSLLSEVGRERERLDRVINSIDDGIVVLDADRNVLAANRAFLRRMPGGRAGTLCCQGGSAGDCSVDECPTLLCLRTGVRQARICEYRTPDGPMVWEEIHASPIRDAGGHVVQIVEVWRDISERRAAEARLAESHRLVSLGLLASGFSHELNTPLGTILMAVEAIYADAGQASASGEATWRRVADHAGVAREQVLRCRGITQHFLRLARGQPAVGEVVDLRAAIGAVARLIAPTARNHGVAIDVEPVPPGLHVYADESGLQQTLMNLVLNAVQACSRGGRVVVSVSDGDPIGIRVFDNGCGIPAGQEQRIFEPFFGLRKGGTGLGLFLSLNFARTWGGDLRVESVDGVGSTFEIVLPAALRRLEGQA